MATPQSNMRLLHNTYIFTYYGYITVHPHPLDSRFSSGGVGWDPIGRIRSWNLFIGSGGDFSSVLFLLLFSLLLTAALFFDRLGEKMSFLANSARRSVCKPSKVRTPSVTHGLSGKSLLRETSPLHPPFGGFLRGSMNPLWTDISLPSSFLISISPFHPRNHFNENFITFLG
jgi:hypothetical protein